MIIYGFVTTKEWEDNPFSEFSPEAVICEACHVYYDNLGNQYIGMELSLGLDEEYMKSLLEPFANNPLGIFRVSL